MTTEHQEIFRDLCTKVDDRSVLDAAIEHIAQLKADNKRLRDLLEPSEIDFSQLVAQEDEIKLLMARCAELEAKNARTNARLIELAAQMATRRGMPSPDDWPGWWPRVPQKLWRAARDECDKASSQCADWAYELRKIADEALAATEPKP